MELGQSYSNNETTLNASPLNKMATILADNIFLNENDGILIQTSLKCILRSPIYNNTALVQVMAWRQKGYKPLPEPLMTEITDIYMQH